MLLHALLDQPASQALSRLMPGRQLTNHGPGGAPVPDRCDVTLRRPGSVGFPGVSTNDKAKSTVPYVLYPGGTCVVEPRKAVTRKNVIAYVTSVSLAIMLPRRWVNDALISYFFFMFFGGRITH